MEHYRDNPQELIKLSEEEEESKIKKENNLSKYREI
jgi:hypothetical protein